MKQNTLLILLLLITTKASALWIKMDDCELINKSPIIVKAEFREGNLTELGDAPAHVGMGTLIVEHIYKGDIKLRTILIKQPKPNGPRKSTDITFEQGQSGIWYLAQSPYGSHIYSAGQPQRYKTWSSEEESKLRSQFCRCKASGPDQGI